MVAIQYVASKTSDMISVKEWTHMKVSNEYSDCHTILNASQIGTMLLFVILCGARRYLPWPSYLLEKLRVASIVVRIAPCGRKKEQDVNITVLWIIFSFKTHAFTEGTLWQLVSQASGSENECQSSVPLHTPTSLSRVCLYKVDRPKRHHAPKKLKCFSRDLHHGSQPVRS